MISESFSLFYRFSIGINVLSFRFRCYEVAVFHVITHAFKACLFLVGSVIHALHGEQDMRNMGGLKAMPITFATI
jgi:NADH-quinone oxidoreductase subunit L